MCGKLLAVSDDKEHSDSSSDRANFVTKLIAVAQAKSVYLRTSQALRWP